MAIVARLLALSPELVHVVDGDDETALVRAAAGCGVCGAAGFSDALVLASHSTALRAAATRTWWRRCCARARTRAC
jgi:hypothetical protein